MNILHVQQHQRGFNIVDADGWIIGSAASESYANLYAAAPELLSALRAITELYNTDEGCRNTPEYVGARAAIAKALGEAS